MLIGVHLTVLIGPTVPLPAPVAVVEALEGVEVTHSDEGRSGFQLTFHVGRSGPLDLVDHPLLLLPQLRPFSRVVLIVTLGPRPRVLMDGVVTHTEVTPKDEPGASRLTVTGEDVSVMMDLEERSLEHPAQDETVIANKIILTYARFGLVPRVLPPLAVDPPIPIERTPVQQDTDLGYLTDMAARHGYVFYVSPGPVPGLNTAYWGPPTRLDVPQRAITVNMGPESNAESVSFRNDALGPELRSGQVQDRLTNATIPVQTQASLRPPLSAQPSWLVNQPNVRRARFRASGLDAMQALARAQGATDASIDAVSADGELDAGRYGDILQARGVVGVRGAGLSYDGLYYVKRVTHSIARGSWAQRFSLTREGVGTTTPAVLP